MTTTYGHSRADVRRWPDDPDVRRALEEYLDYLDKLPGGSRPVESLLNGAGLERAEFEDADFRQAGLRGACFGRASLFGADLRGADLRECVFGRSGHSTSFTEARLAGCLAEGAQGMVKGPIDVGADSPQLLDGAALQRWLAERGAPLVEVRQPAQQ
jgi:hypothetical protein